MPDLGVCPSLIETVSAAAAGQPNQVGHAPAADPVHAAGARACDHLPLPAAQGCLSHAPAVADLSDPLLVGDVSVVDKALEELRLTR